MPGLGAAFLDDPANGLGDLVKLFDVAIGDPSALKRLDGAMVEHKLARLVAAKLNQFDAGRTDVQTQQRRVRTVE